MIDAIATFTDTIYRAVFSFTFTSFIFIIEIIFVAIQFSDLGERNFGDIFSTIA